MMYPHQVFLFIGWAILAASAVWSFVRLLLSWLGLYH